MTYADMRKRADVVIRRGGEMVKTPLRDRLARDVLALLAEIERKDAALKAAQMHMAELANAWERGALSEHAGQGGTRSNRNEDVCRRVTAALAPLPVKGDAK